MDVVFACAESCGDRFRSGRCKGNRVVWGRSLVGVSVYKPVQFSFGGHNEPRRFACTSLQNAEE